LRGLGLPSSSMLPTLVAASDIYAAVPCQRRATELAAAGRGGLVAQLDVKGR
jgi:hypothetical protein